jgi:hypothetical protein
MATERAAMNRIAMKPTSTATARPNRATANRFSFIRLGVFASLI